MCDVGVSQIVGVLHLLWLRPAREASHTAHAYHTKKSDINTCKAENRR